MFPSSASPSSSFYSFSGSSGSHLIQARKLLLQSNSYLASSNKAAAPSMNGHGPSNSHIGQSKFDADVVMVLSFLLCVLICALGLNSIIRCALKCSSGDSYVTRDAEIITQLSNTGIKKKALKTFPIVTYLAGSNQPGLDTECVICLSEFNTGERLRVLPKCHHGFHIRFIDKWLMAHSSCPTCRHCLIDTCRKIVGISQASSLEPQSTVSLQGGILPLEHEGFIRNLRGIC